MKSCEKKINREGTDQPLIKQNRHGMACEKRNENERESASGVQHQDTPTHNQQSEKDRCYCLSENDACKKAVASNTCRDLNEDHREEARLQVFAKNDSSDQNQSHLSDNTHRQSLAEQHPLTQVTNVMQSQNRDHSHGPSNESAQQHRDVKLRIDEGLRSDLSARSQDYQKEEVQLAISAVRTDGHLQAGLEADLSDGIEIKVRNQPDFLSIDSSCDITDELCAECPGVRRRRERSNSTCSFDAMGRDWDADTAIAFTPNKKGIGKHCNTHDSLLCGKKRTKASVEIMSTSASTSQNGPLDALFILGNSINAKRQAKNKLRVKSFYDFFDAVIS